MLKRKYGDRSNWNRILKRQYAQAYLDTTEFKGYITLLDTQKVAAPLVVKYGDKNICIVDDGYMWLQQFPMEKRHSVTTMFDANGDVTQWYIDICLENGMDCDIPWMDDLFLDIVLLPSGEVFLLDEDELEMALGNGTIDNSLYNMAWEEANKITELINTGKFDLLQLSYEHKRLLVEKLK